MRIVGQPYYFRNANTGNCIDVTGGGTDDGTIIDSYACGLGNPSQMWQINANDDGSAVYNLSLTSSGYQLKNHQIVTQCVQDMGSTVLAETCTSGADQSYVLIPATQDPSF